MEKMAREEIKECAREGLRKMLEKIIGVYKKMN